MRIIAEKDVKKDSWNRVTLPAAEYEHYRARFYEDGHIELTPQILSEAMLSKRTLEMMGASTDHMGKGEVGPVLDLYDMDSGEVRKGECGDSNAEHPHRDRLA